MNHPKKSAIHRAEIGKTPEQIREEFSKDRIQIGPVNVEPRSMGVLMVLEAVNSPVVSGDKPLPVGAEQGTDERGGPKPKRMSMIETARIILAFHDSEMAYSAFLDGGLTAVDKAAMNLMQLVPPDLVPEIVAAILGRCGLTPEK